MSSNYVVVSSVLVGVERTDVGAVRAESTVSTTLSLSLLVRFN